MSSKRFIIIGVIVALFLLSAQVTAAITYQGAQWSSASGSGSLSLAINRPTGAAGDVLIAQITVTGRSANPTINAPTGWTLVNRTNYGTGAGQIGQAIYYRVWASGEPTSYTWSFSGGSSGTRYAIGNIVSYRGVDTTNPIVDYSGAGGNSQSLIAQGVTAEAGSMLVGFFGDGRNEAINTPPGMTSRADRGTTSLHIQAADQAVGAGPTGTRTATTSTADNWVAQLVALREYQPKGSISGYKTYPNGTPIGNWQITLTNQTNGISRTCTTAANGYYIFQDLPLYYYQLNETLPGGWTQWPTTPNRTIQLNSTNLTFTNQTFINNICPPPPPPPPEGNLTINKTVSPKDINLSGSSCAVQNATVNISISGYGCGIPECGAHSPVPMDVIFAIDNSGSMSTSDPTNLRLSGAKEFIGEMNASKDQVGIINWNTAVKDPTYPPSPYPPGLGNNFTAANQTINLNLPVSGYTCGECALDRALEMMQNNPRCPNVNSSKAIILLTDGDFNRGCNAQGCFADEISLANSLNTKIITIGLGNDVNPTILTYIAQGTGGSYYFAATAEDIAYIFNRVYSEVVSVTSPSYVNVTEVLEPYIIVDQGSFNIPPNSTDIPNNTYVWTNIAQHVGNKNHRLNVIETVNITFNISSSLAGNNLAVNNGTAKVNYVNSSGVPVEVPLPSHNVTVNVSSCPEDKFCIDGHKLDNCTSQGLPDWTIRIINETSVEVGNATTNATGYYKICNLSPGNYTVCEDSKTGWMNVSPKCQIANLRVTVHQRDEDHRL